MTGPGDRARVKIRCLEMVMGMIWLHFELGFGSYGSSG